MSNQLPHIIIVIPTIIQSYNVSSRNSCTVCTLYVIIQQKQTNEKTTANTETDVLHNSLKLQVQENWGNRWEIRVSDSTKYRNYCACL